MGRAVVANASVQILLKQSPTAVDVLADVFKLTDEEKKRLSQFPVGQGLFFAGQNHVHIQVIASPTETDLISTNSSVTPQPSLEQSVDLQAMQVPAEPVSSPADQQTTGV